MLWQWQQRSPRKWRDRTWEAEGSLSACHRRRGENSFLKGEIRWEVMKKQPLVCRTEVMVLGEEG